MFESYSNQSSDSALLQKLAAQGGTYIKDRLLEEMFTDKILPLEGVSIDDNIVQVSDKHDQPVVVIPIEPNSWAMTVNWRGYNEAEIIRAPRMFSAFETISSGVYQKTTQELLVYQRLGQPLTKMIEDRIPFDLEKIIDRTFISHVDACIWTMQRQANSGDDKNFDVVTLNAGNVVEYSVFKSASARLDTTNPSPFVLYPMTKADTGTLANILVMKSLKPNKMLMSEYDFNQLMAMTFEELGDKTYDTLEKGMSMLSSFNNMPYIRTIKVDVLRPGNVYVFAAPDYFGKFYSLGDVEFYIKKEDNVMTFQARRMISMGFANVNAVGKMELYPCNSNPNGTLDTYIDDTNPKREEDLWDTTYTEGLYEGSVTAY